MNEPNIVQLTIIDTQGVLEDRVDEGIEADRFVYNLHEDEAAAELENLEAAIRATGVRV